MARRDPQESASWTWEHDLTGWAGPRHSEKELREIITKACRIYRVPVPQIQFGRTNQANGAKLPSVYDPNCHLIILRSRHYEACSAIHEAAHAVVCWILGSDTQTHGREWLGVHMILLERLQILPRAAMHAHARELGLKFCTERSVGPAVIRKRHPAKVKRAREERDFVIRDGKAFVEWLG